MQKNTTLAMDILREEKKHTRFWFIAFVVTLAVSVASHVLKGGAKHE